MKHIYSILIAAWVCCAGSYAKENKYTESYNYQRGVELLRQNNPDEGIRFLERELDEHPKNGYAYAWRASAYKQKDEYGSAIYDLERAIKYLPKKDKRFHAWSHSMKSDIFLEIQDTTAALKEISQSVKIQPQEEEWLYRRSQIYKNLKQYELSNADLRRIIQLSPGIITGYIYIGNNYFEQGQYAQALEQYSYAHKLAKRHFTYAFMAQAQIKLGQYEQAANNVFEALKLDVNSDEAIAAINMCTKDEFLNPLLTLVNIQIDKYPNNMDWLGAKSYILTAAKRYAEEIEVLKQVRKVNADPSIDKIIGYMYFLCGNFPNALIYANTMIAADTSDVEAYKIRSDIYFEMDSIQLALADASKIEKLAPDNADALYSCSQTYFFCGHYQRAITMMDRVLALNPTDHYFRYLRGRSYLALGDSVAAAIDFNRAYKESPRGMTKAFSLCFLNRPKEARPIVDSVCIADSVFYEERYNAACAYAFMGDTKRAFELLEEELKDGYVRFNHIRHDPDLIVLHGQRLDSLLNLYEQKVLEKLSAISADSAETGSMRVVEVPFTSANGVTKVDCTINGLPLNFIFDTGASDVTISQTEANFMFKNGYLSPKDIVGKQRYGTADGSVHVGTVFILNYINFGGLELTGVQASVVANQKAPLLLGQTVLKRLGKIEIDNERRVLKITTIQ